jgi:DNA polymerase-1
MNSNYKEGRNPLRLNRDVRNLTENEEISNRIWQQTRVAEYFNQMPIIQLLYPNIEADDLISYVANHQHYKKWQKVIVSADKDFIQLINDKTVLYRPIQEEILNVAKVIEKYGVHPNNFALARAITGDDSDNLKGVRGVGMATVAKKLPMLTEDKSYLPNDVVEFSKDKEGKAFISIASSFDAIRDNYRIMQLSSPQISYQVKQQIDEVIENFNPELNQLEFRRMSMQDGFGVVDFSSLMTTFKKIVANKTT